MYICTYLQIYVEVARVSWPSKTPPIDHLVIREFMGGPPRYIHLVCDSHECM